MNVVSIRDKIDTSNAMGRCFFRIMASIAELERDMISERTSNTIVYNNFIFSDTTNKIKKV